MVTHRRLLVYCTCWSSSRKSISGWLSFSSFPSHISWIKQCKVHLMFSLLHHNVDWLAPLSYWKRNDNHTPPTLFDVQQKQSGIWQVMKKNPPFRSKSCHVNLQSTNRCVYTKWYDLLNACVSVCVCAYSLIQQKRNRNMSLQMRIVIKEHITRFFPMAICCINIASSIFCFVFPFFSVSSLSNSLPDLFYLFLANYPSVLFDKFPFIALHSLALL